MTSCPFGNCAAAVASVGTAAVGVKGAVDATGIDVLVKDAVLDGCKVSAKVGAGGNGEAATELVENMREISKTSELPPQMQKAYAKHLEAWNNYAEHVNSRAHLTESDRLCPELDLEINKTYDELLDTAKDFGVTFPR